MATDNFIELKCLGELFLVNVATISAIGIDQTTGQCAVLTTAASTLVDDSYESVRQALSQVATIVALKKLEEESDG